MTQSLSGQKKEKVNVCFFFSSSLNTKNMGPPWSSGSHWWHKLCTAGR